MMLIYKMPIHKDDAVVRGVEMVDEWRLPLLEAASTAGTD